MIRSNRPAAAALAGILKPSASKEMVPDCRPVWVATASFDVGIELSSPLHLPTHRIDPHIDAERALIVSDLLRAGATELGMIVVVPPLRGTNAAGDPFTTDGRAVILMTAHAR